MSFENDSLRGVRVQYGPRFPGFASGQYKTEGSAVELTMDVTGEVLNAPDTVADVVVPAGAYIEKAFYETTEVFTLGGTTPAIEIGTNGSEATNGVTVTEAQAEAVGAGDITAQLAGTWDNAALAADTTVGIAMSGTSPTSATTGKLRVTIVYRKTSV
jgi:hypothetical protein